MVRKPHEHIKLILKLFYHICKDFSTEKYTVNYFVFTQLILHDLFSTLSITLFCIILVLYLLILLKSFSLTDRYLYVTLDLKLTFMLLFA